MKVTREEINERISNTHRAKNADRNMQIIRRIASGEKYRVVAADFGLSRQRIEQIVNRDKSAARLKTSAAIQNGKLVRPDRCESCKRKRKHIEAHHDDYAKPLDVRWLCRKCHGKEGKTYRSRVNYAWACAKCGRVRETQYRFMAAKRRYCSRKCTPNRPIKYTDDEMLLLLRWLAVKLNRTPINRDMKMPTFGCWWTEYYKRFGSLTKVSLRVGLVPSGRGARGAFAGRALPLSFVRENQHLAQFPTWFAALVWFRGQQRSAT